MARRRRFFVGVAAVLLGAAAVLAGCGQKGPLYFPDDQQKKKPQKKSALDPLVRPG